MVPDVNAHLEPEARHTGLRLLRTSAYAVIVLAGLKAAAALVTPIVLAALLAIACIPPSRGLRRLGIPDTIAAFLVVIGAVGILGFFSAIIGNSIATFAESSDKYVEVIDEHVASLREWAKENGLDLAALGDSEPNADPAGELGGNAPEGAPADGSAERAPLKLAGVDISAQLSRLFDLVMETATGVLGGASDAAVVLLVMIFILLEASGLPNKLRRAIGSDDADLSTYSQVMDQIFGYLTIKTAVSVLTGVLATLLTAAFGVDFPILWGLIAFVFNYVPNVGSIIAALPPVLLAWIQPELGLAPAAGVATGYIIINMLVGNLLEPRIMGRRLGLSPLVVLLSLIFWNWMLGAVGMVLSIPLTMIVKIAMEHDEDFRPVAVLLGPSDAEPEPADESRAG